jgi:hypothetical protein
MDETFTAHPVSRAGSVEEIDAAQLEHTGSHTMFDVLASA